jgi:hypothetical protein
MNGVLRRRDRATLEDVVELLRGIGTMLMKIDAKLEAVVQYLEGEDGEEADT